MIEVKLPRCLVVLSEAELLYLLSLDKDVWAQGLKRGRAITRARQREARAAAKAKRRGD